MYQTNYELDTVGMNCPLPILKTRQTLKSMSPGEVLKIKATDIGAIKDLSAFCDQTGNELLGHENLEGVLVFYVKKS